VSAELIKSGTATHGLIGASVSNSEAEENSVVAGALVREVTVDGPSDEAGLLADDIIVKFNGLPITSSADITAQVRAVAAGSTGELVVVRAGKNVTLTVDVGTL
jgi:putative serine protease PepD